MIDLLGYLTLGVLIAIGLFAILMCLPGPTDEELATRYRLF